MPLPAATCPARGDELIDDDLGAVGEVAELGLPDHEHLRIDERVAVVEAEHRGLGEQRVVDAESGLVVVDVVEGDVGFASLGVVPGRVALGEGSAHAVLPGQPYGESLQQEGAEGQEFGERPVDRPRSSIVC